MQPLLNSTGTVTHLALTPTRVCNLNLKIGLLYH